MYPEMDKTFSNLSPEISLSTILIFVIVFLICYISMSRSNLPPGPCKFPVIGSFWWFVVQTIRKNRPAREFFKVAKKYGDVMHFQVGSENLVVITGYDAIQEALVKRSDDFSARPSRLLDSVQKGAKGVVMSNGKPWKMLRKFTMQALKDFGVGKATLEENILVEVDAATEYLKETRGEPINPRLMTSMIITNVIYGIVFGKRYEYSDQYFHEIIENLDISFRTGIPIDVTSQVPTIIWRLLGNKERAEAPTVNLRAANWVRNHILEEIKEHEESYDESNIRDFVDLFIKEKQKGSEKEMFTEHELFYVIQDLFLAGSETTSNTLNWIILYMQEYPEVQEQCQKEIKQKYGERPVRWADRGTLPFVEATLMEIQRMANIAELSVPHTNLHETSFRGYKIPKDSIIHANLYSSNMDTRYWESPEQFKPERFLQDGNITKNPALLPFSIGPRVCLGENLAKMELFLTFTNFLQRFTFKKEDADRKHTFECIEGQITSAPLPYKTRALYRC